MDPENEPTNPVEGADEHVQTPAEVANADDQHQPDLQDGQDPNNSDNPGDLTAEELAEIEYEGQTYKVPPALKDAVLRQADYTRKTQDVAEQRKALDTERQSLVQQAEAQREFIKEYARVEQVEERIGKLQADRAEHLKTISELRETDWQQWQAINPAEAQRDWDRYQAARAAIQDYPVDLAGLEGERDNLKSQLQAKQSEWASKARAEHANALEKANAELARDLKDDWNPQTQRKLAEYGQSLGYSADELNGITDPRAIKALYAAWKGSEALKAQAAAATLKAQQAARPVSTVGGAAPHARRTTDASGDGLSTEEWMRRERERVASRGRR